MKTKVLFVCIGNSCRSQMAEGFARALGGEEIEAWSAGSHPSGRVNPTAIRVMGEKGIALSGHRSKGLREVPAEGWDYVITMGCGDACPFVPSKAKEDWAVPDPNLLPLAQFRRLRDMIEEKVKALLKEIKT